MFWFTNVNTFFVCDYALMFACLLSGSLFLRAEIVELLTTRHYKHDKGPQLDTAHKSGNQF